MTTSSGQVDQRAAAIYLLKLKQSANSFPGFMAYYYDFVWEAFQSELQEVLDLLEKDALLSAGGNPVRNLLITMPPRHAKSFNATINFPAYALMRKPHREIMVSSYNAELAATFGRATRDIVTDPRARKAFKGFDLSKETRAVDFWKTTAGGAYYAVGLNGTTTGRGVSGGLYMDDPYKSREEADSTTQRRKVWDFYTSGLLSRMQPDREGQPPFQVVTMTRWHPDDMAGRIQESREFKAGEWLHLNYQALTLKQRKVYVRRNSLPSDDPRYVPNVTPEQMTTGRRTEEGKPMLSSGLVNPMVSVDDDYDALWPSRFPVKWLQTQRSLLGDRDFESLYQQNPYVLGGNLIKESWFRKYKREDLPPTFHALAVTVDTAFKTKTVNDYSVFTVGGITEIGDIYILKVFREKLEFPDLKRKAVSINSLYRAQGLRGFWIEDNASGQSLIQELRANSGVPVIPWKPGSQDKFQRAASVTPLVEGGRVFIPEEADWLEDWINELSAFPSSKNDDQVDSFVMLLDVMSRMVITGMKEFSTPIGDLVGKNGMQDLLFAGQPLAADPKGWGGGGGNSFGGAIGKPGVWAGWGN